MAAITGMNTTATNAVEIDEIWSDLVLTAARANYVMSNLVERRDQDVMSSGDKIHFPIPGTLSPVAYTNGKRLTDNLAAPTDTEVVLDIDKKYFVPVHVQWDVSAQSKYDILAMQMEEAGIAMASQIDTDVATLADSLTTSIINDPAATAQVGNLALSHIVDSFTTLNSNNVPERDRQWVFHPSAYGELLQISGNYFVSHDFRQGTPLETGLIGQILGAPVYQSTNVDTRSEGSPAETAYNNLYFHKQAFALAKQRGIDAKVDQEHTDTMGALGYVRALYGVKVLRSTWGVRIVTIND